MKRPAVTAIVLAFGLLIGASPAAALSCAEPEPFDMAAAIAASDAAAIGTITSISSSGANDLGGEELVLTIEVSEVFKGSVRGRLTLERSTSVWGPYYEEWTELALLVNGEVVRDGQDSLCGPYFYPAGMRAAGGDPAPPQPEVRGWGFFALFRILLDMFSFLR